MEERVNTKGFCTLLYKINSVCFECHVHYCIPLCKLMLNEKYKLQKPVFQGCAEQYILSASDGLGYVSI